VKTSIVASVQFEPKLLNVEHNLSTALKLTFEAAAKGARVIVLPELCIGGNVFDDSREALECAQTRDGYQTEAFAPIARKFNCHIIFGYVELNDNKLYNSAAIVGPSGYVGNAQKHNLWGRDNIWATASDAMAPLIVTEVGRLGALICRDGSNKYRESYQFFNKDHRFYHKGSADVIALLTNWGSDYAYPDSGWVDLVESTNANVIVSNRVGTERDMEYKGGSCVISRDKYVWTNGSNFTSEAVVGGVVLL
jgi:N-carbamoylputrescine amidase